MPREPRLDAPDVLHHVMARGLERRRIFRDDHDREDFVCRLAALVAAGALTVYAWVLMPNHFHLLVRTGQRPLAPFYYPQVTSPVAKRQPWVKSVRRFHPRHRGIVPG